MNVIVKFFNLTMVQVLVGQLVGETTQKECDWKQEEVELPSCVWCIAKTTSEHTRRKGGADTECTVELRKTGSHVLLSNGFPPMIHFQLHTLCFLLLSRLLSFPLQYYIMISYST